MFLFVLLPVLLVLGALLVAGPALLPFALIGAITFVVWRTVSHHHHSDRTVRPH